MPTPDGIIDLKQAQLFLVDGYSNVGAVNLMAGYTTGLATMAVDGIVGIIQNGTTFNVGTDATIYTVLSHTETSANTTSITFAPGLVVAATDDEVIVFLPNSIEVRIGEGNLTFETKSPREYKLNRGKLYLVRNGDQAPTEVNFDFVWDHIIGISGDPVTIEEALTQTGNAASWVSSATSTCEPYAVNLKLLYTPVCASAEKEIILFPDFRQESLNHNLKDGTVACKGSSNRIRPTVTRVA